VGTFLTPTIIARQALLVLENELVMANLVHRDYSKEFQKVGSTVLIRKPASFTSTVVSDTVNMATATESSVAVVLDKHLDITVEVTSQELTLDIVDFSEQILRPMMRAHAQAIDKYLCNEYVNVAAHYAVSDTPAISDITGVRAVMNVLKVPLTERRCVLHPMTEADYLHLDAFLHAEKRGDTRAIKEASMGRVLGFDFYMDQNIAEHTTGGLSGGGTATIQLKGAATAGATAITVDGCVSGGTANAYDVFKIVGYDQWHVLGQAATANVGTCTLNFQPALSGARVDDATVVFQQSHRANLAFHKNAFAMVTAPLEPPLGGAKATTVTYKGISARVVYDYTIMTKKNVISIDLLCGFKTLDRDLACRLCDAR